jgi:hypothetical protein
VRRATSVGVVVVVLVAPLLGRWAGPRFVPVDRLIVNLSQRVSEKPEDPHRHYQLGRVCSLAFALNLEALQGNRRVNAEDDAEFEVESVAAQLKDSYGKPKPSSVPRNAERNLELLSIAVRELSFAAASPDAPPAYSLGLGYVLVSGAHLATSFESATLLGLVGRDHISIDEYERLDDALASLSALPPEEKKDSNDSRFRSPRIVAYLDDRRADPNPAIQAIVAELLTDFWLQQALASYVKAYQSALHDDLSRKEMPSNRGDDDVGMRSMISYEAGQAILELAHRLGTRAILPEGMLDALPKQLAQLAALPPPTWITPILMDLEESAALEELLDPDRIVRFDLDGDGIAELRKWVRPDTGLLVWDPEGRGEITSGRQLFGDATWWMFFRNGYEALDALDDDRDGWLAGGELAGLALWRDADSDAVSDPGEVEDLACLGVTALATRSDTLDGLAPGATRGAWLADGRCLPTWDWVAEPMPEPPADPDLISRATDPIP